MADSVWAFDHAAERSGLANEDLNSLHCFVICPTQPRALHDYIYELIKQTCAHLASAHRLAINCGRAIDIASSGLIHPEIWRLIRLADFIIADVTGGNGNVMLELGVASAWHPKEHIVIIRQEDPSQTQLFDIQPVRHIEYSCTPTGFQKLYVDLLTTIQDVIASSPFREIEASKVALPLDLHLDGGHDAPELWTPGMAHRRIIPGDTWNLDRCIPFDMVGLVLEIPG